MNVLDPLPRAEFLALANRSEPSFREHRSKGQMLLWHEAGKAPKSQNRALKLCVHDALLFRTAWCIVSQGASWAGVALALPGLQLCLRDGLDREDTFAVITVLSKSQFVVGCGTAEELQKAGVIGPPAQMFAMSIPIIVEYMQRRAAEHDITLPHKLAPDISARPAWVASKKELFGTVRHSSGIVVTFSPHSHGSVAMLTASI
ncbi:MAG TPA: hypothetical protein VIE66_13240 [Methylocella sp.]|jgi:hypothetical protein